MHLQSILGLQATHLHRCRGSNRAAKVDWEGGICIHQMQVPANLSRELRDGNSRGIRPHMVELLNTDAVIGWCQFHGLGGIQRHTPRGVLPKKRAPEARIWIMEPQDRGLRDRGVYHTVSWVGASLPTHGDSSFQAYWTLHWGIGAPN